MNNIPEGWELVTEGPFIPSQHLVWSFVDNKFIEIQQSLSSTEWITQGLVIRRKPVDKVEEPTVLTARQQLAGMAMQGILAKGYFENADSIARWAISCADALLKASRSE